MLSTDTETVRKIKVQRVIFTRFSLGRKLQTSGPDFSKLIFELIALFDPFLIQMAANFARFVFKTSAIYLCGFHTSCCCWVSRQPSPRSNYSPSPPMKLMTSQSLPPSSASSVMIMSHRIDLAGLACRKNSLTLHCFLAWNSNQSDKISPPYPLVFTQNKSATHPRIGLGLGSLLTPSKTVSPLVFFRLHWLEHGRCPCSSENLSGTF